MSYLAKCRYCGSENVDVQFDDWGVGFNADGIAYFVECGDCFAAGPRKNIEQDAVNSWNAFNGTCDFAYDSRNESSTCDSCGCKYFHDTNEPNIYVNGAPEDPSFCPNCGKRIDRIRSQMFFS